MSVEIYLGTTAKLLAAHRFYEKSGFTEIEKIALPESFPVMTVDTKFYTRRLEPMQALVQNFTAGRRGAQP